jgi:hypothetical protein
MTEVELIEKTALRVGMKSLMNHGAASCVYTEGCNGVSQEHLIAFAREVALHCVAALAHPPAAEPKGMREALEQCVAAMEMKQRVTMWEQDGDRAKFSNALNAARAALAAAQKGESNG